MKFMDWIVSKVAKKAIKARVDTEVSSRVAMLQRRTINATGQGLLNQYQFHATQGQESASSLDELLDRYAVQACLRAPIDKVAKIVGTCKPTISLRPGFSEIPEQRAYLENLIAHPHKRTSFSNVIFETVVRLKVAGECAWEWIYPESNSIQIARGKAMKALKDVMVTNERARRKALSAPAMSPDDVYGIVRKARDVVNEQAQRLENLPVGFKVLQGVVNPNVNKRGEIEDLEKAYLQIVSSGDEQWFREKDVLWMSGPNPVGGAHALPPFESVRFLDDIDEKVHVYQNSVLDNRGELGGVITIKNPGVGELDRTRQEMENQFRGPEHAGKWYVVGVEGDGDTKVEKFGIEPIRIESEDNAQRRLRLMWAVINVPGAKIGFTEEVNRANIEMQDKALLEEEVLPLCRLVVEPFNQFIQVTLGIESYELRFSQADLRTETDKIDMREKRLKIGMMTMNDMLIEDFGEDAMVKDGDIRILELGKGMLIFTPDKPVHLVTASGTVIPLFSDTSSPGPEIITPGGQQRRPMAPDVEADVEGQNADEDEEEKPKVDRGEDRGKPKVGANGKRR